MIKVDIHEPSQLFTTLVESTGIPIEVGPFNELSLADYSWRTGDGELVHVERKQWGEVISGMDAVEDQLRRHLTNQPHSRLIFLIEGLLVPNHQGVVILKPTSKPAVYITGHGSTIRYSQIVGWLYQIQRFVEVYQTPNYEGTAMAIVAMYKGDQKAEHDTFQRYYKKLDWVPNPRVQQLMGLIPNLGPERAKALIEKYTTVWGVMNSTPKELATVPGIGKVLSKQILQKIGRPDV